MTIKNINFMLSNDGMGVALNVNCKLENGELKENNNYGVSLSIKEKCMVLFELLSNNGIKEEDIGFIFSYYDIFENRYEQKIVISISSLNNYSYMFTIKYIENPRLCEQYNT